MKKLMILGASYSQLPLYEAAKRLGVFTVAASTPGDWPGFDIADESSYTDISDCEAVLEAARKLQVNGIATCCLDTGVRALGYACEQMGLVGLSASAGELSSDKYKMKEAFVKGGVNCARHICVKNKQELEKALEVLPFPIIVKAVDLMGSRGMFRCNTKKEALERYEDTMQATRKDYCLVEEFIEGTVLGCEAMVANGELIYCLPNNIEAYQSHVPTPIGHSVPYKKKEPLEQEVIRQVTLAVEALGLNDCPVNCDLIEKDGQIYVIEITGRAGATCLPEMVSLYYGMDYYEAIVRLALGMPVKELFQEDMPHKAVLAHIITSEIAGIVQQIENKNIPAEDIVDLSFNIQPGDEVRKYENGRDRIGQVILTGDSLQDCEERLVSVLEKINIEFTV